MRLLQIVPLIVFFPAAAVAQVCNPASPPPLLAASGASGVGTMSRQEAFDYLVNVWFDPTRNVIQEINCPAGRCLWVPFYENDTSCDFTKLKTDCGVTPDNSYTISCLSSDQFSQVGYALAMSADQAAFDEWVTTTQFLIDNSTTTEVPAWLAKRNGAVLSIADGSDASDATARIIIALYVAATNGRFSNATAKASYRSMADRLAGKFILDDFATRSATIGGITITHWLGGGSATALNHSNLDGMEMWAGYYGDAVIALLAAFRSTGDATFLTYAQDTVASYLVAASWDGNDFSVPPKQFTWRINGVGLPYADCPGCTEWDYDDAPRAVSLCKAPYYAALNRVDLGTALSRYCSRWMQSRGVSANAYQPKYTLSGVPAPGLQGGYYETGLGAAINFAWQSFDLWTKLSRGLAEFSTSTNSFLSASCMGVYRPAFLITSLGSAIGDDAKAFANCDDALPDAISPAITVLDSCGYVLDPYRLLITVHGLAMDNRFVQDVSYTLSGSTSGSGPASGAAMWSIGPLTLNGGTTTITITAHDAAGNTAVENCSVTLSTFLPQQPPSPRRRASRP
jgi:hypothetical protein